MWSFCNREVSAQVELWWDCGTRMGGGCEVTREMSSLRVKGGKYM
jgi:hypothetical protein